VDDSSITFWKDKKQWELGPVLASTKVKPSGAIMFYDILGVVSHGQECPLVKAAARPNAYKNSTCLHVRTPEKMFNLLSAVESQDYTKWATLIRDAIRIYQAKKDAKALLSKKLGRNSISTFNFDEEEEDDEGSTVNFGTNRKSAMLSKQKVKKVAGVQWVPDSSLAELMPIETSVYPFYTSNVEETPMSPKGRIDKGVNLTSSQELPGAKVEVLEGLFQAVANYLITMNDAEAHQFLETFLDFMEQEGLLKALTLKLFSMDAKRSILAVCKTPLHASTGQFLSSEAVLQRVARLLRDQLNK